MSDQETGKDRRPTRSDETYSDKEAAQRRDAVVRRMLNTPPQPRAKPPPKPKGRPAQKGRVHRAKSRS